MDKAAHVVTDQWLAMGRRALEEVPAPPTDGSVSPAFVASVFAPVVQLIEDSNSRIVGVAGPAGSGKSTLVRYLAESLENSNQSALAVSLDDFYYSKAKREELGFVFRAVPGTHDVQALCDLLKRARASEVPLSVPRFDASIDDCGESEILNVPLDIVLVDGWFLGMKEHGYEEVLPHLDLLIHLRVPEELARARRLAREAGIRQRTGGGLSEATVERFWNEVLGPGGSSWVRSSEESADLILDFNVEGELNEVRATSALPIVDRSEDAG